MEITAYVEEQVVRKTAIYFGQEIIVPDWVNYMAVDSDNTLWGYSLCPVISSSGRWRARVDDKNLLIAYVKFEEKCWEESLAMV